MIPLLLFFLIISYPSQAYFYFNTGYSYSPVSYSGFSYYGGSVYPYFFIPRYLYAGPRYFRFPTPFQPSLNTQFREQKQAEALLIYKIKEYYAPEKQAVQNEISDDVPMPDFETQSDTLNLDENVEIRYY